MNIIRPSDDYIRANGVSLQDVQVGYNFRNNIIYFLGDKLPPAQYLTSKNIYLQGADRLVLSMGGGAELRGWLGIFDPTDSVETFFYREKFGGFILSELPFPDYKDFIITRKDYLPPAPTGTYDFRNAIAIQINSNNNGLYFNRYDLLQWISQSQLEQFTSMYSDVIEVAYHNAVSFVWSQIGEMFDMNAILTRTPPVTDGRNNTVDQMQFEATCSIMEWMLEVLTAWNICSAGLNPSMPLQTNYTMVVEKLTEIKNGATTMANAPIKAEPNAFPRIYTSNKSYIG